MREEKKRGTYFIIIGVYHMCVSDDIVVYADQLK